VKLIEAKLTATPFPSHPLGEGAENDVALAILRRQSSVKDLNASRLESVFTQRSPRATVDED
jgi:hypothetical protein